MSIFRRGKKTDEAEALEAVEAVDTADGGPETSGAVGPFDDATLPAGARGPFDSAQVDAAQDGRLDLGALRILGVPGMELRLEVEEEAQQVVAATAVIGDSAVQLQAFAAPRSAGIWDEIRAEIAESILAQGGTADEAPGALGTELRTRMPSAGPDGRTVFAPARFAGVDGPRWFLRAVFSGRAAIDEEAAAPLWQVVRNTVVVRGDAAMAPREMLLLRLPDQAGTPDLQTPEAQTSSQDQSETRTVDDLNPFQRGPEITEVR